MDRSYAAEIYDQPHWLLQQAAYDEEAVRRYSRMKNLIRSFVQDYSGRGLILKCSAGMGKRYLLHRYAQEAGLERVFASGIDHKFRAGKVICSLPGDVSEKELFATIAIAPRALIVFEGSPDGAQMPLLGDTLRNVGSILNRFSGGFVILANPDDEFERDNVFTQFEFPATDFESVLAIAENESSEIADWLMQLGVHNEREIREWVRFVRSVVSEKLGGTGMTHEDIDEYFFFSLHRFLQLIALCPFTGTDPADVESRVRWVGHELHLDTLDGIKPVEEKSTEVPRADGDTGKQTIDAAAIRGLLAVPEWAEKHPHTVAEMLSEMGLQNVASHEILEWTSLFKRVTVSTAMFAGVPVATLDKEIFLSLRGFLSIIGLYSLVHPDDDTMVSRCQWIAEGLSLRDYTPLIEIEGTRIALSR